MRSGSICAQPRASGELYADGRSRDVAHEGSSATRATACTGVDSAHRLEGQHGPVVSRRPA